MAIKLGTTGIGAVYKGSTQIAAIYKGSTLVYQIKQSIQFAGYRLINKCNNTFRLIKRLNNVGSNTYYSTFSPSSLYTDHHYKLVKPKTWEDKTWNGSDKFDAEQIWTDGINVYYSRDNIQYVLDVATSTWTAKTWNGLTNFRGLYIWSDGENIYHTHNNTTKVLDVATSTWTAKTWSGYNPQNSIDIWTDGTNIYYSSGTSHYVLDVATSTWRVKTWSGLTDFRGIYIWTNGTDIFYSTGSTSGPGQQYVLNKSTSTWNAKAWSWPGASQASLKGPDGSAIWTDGIDIYLTNSNGQLKMFTASSSSWYTTTWQKSDTTPIDIYAAGVWSVLPD